MDTALVIIFVGVLVFLSHWFSGIFSRTRVPDVLMLIVVGLAIGPIFGIVRPEHFGVVGPVFVTIALVVILFEGGLGLRLEVLRKSLRGTLTLAIINFLATMFAVGLAAMVLTELDALRSFMLGAILGGTSSAVVIPMLRHLKLKDESNAILFLESAVTDVLCIVVALAFIEAIKLGELRFGTMMGRMLASFLLAGLLGVVGAFVWSVLLHRIRTLQHSIFTTPAFVFILYGAAELLGYSGAIASLAFGVALGNTEMFNLPLTRRYIPREPICLNDTERVFFGEVVFLLKTFFFVYVGLSILFRDVGYIAFGLFLTIVVYVLRIPVVRVAVEKSTPIPDASVMAVMVPKGLAAAVLASIPLQMGIEGGELIQNVTYAMVLFSIVATSVLIFLIEKQPVSGFYHSLFAGFAPAPIPETPPAQENP